MKSLISFSNGSVALNPPLDVAATEQGAQIEAQSHVIKCFRSVSCGASVLLLDPLLSDPAGAFLHGR